MLLGILGSGNGSNFQAIIDAIDQGTLDARIGLVLSDNPSAFILRRAEKHGIPTGILDCREFRSKFPEDVQAATALRLKEMGIELVCLAGFMRIVGKPLLDAYPDRILNIHPSLLPAYPGLEAWRQALENGEKEAGCTVHFVDSGVDSGPIILQESVPILSDDTVEVLHARIQQIEHRLYPAAIRKVARAIVGT